MIGAVPVADDAFDVAFRANRRNGRLLRERSRRDSASRRLLGRPPAQRPRKTAEQS